MRLAISNIAWAQHDDPAVLAALRQQGFQGIEVAPTKLWPAWEGANATSARQYRQQLADAGFAIPALQAVVYGKSFRLFAEDRAERDALLAHFRLVAELAEALGAGAIVFGAPKCRDRAALSEAEAWERACAAFSELGAIFAEHGACLCIEPVPPEYGCNFIHTAEQAWGLVRAVDSPGFGLHVDAAALCYAGESLASLLAIPDLDLRHFHISEPGMTGFAQPRVAHEDNLASLKRWGYANWCSVEVDGAKHELEHSIEWVAARWRQVAGGYS